MRADPISDRSMCYVSANGRDWKAIETEIIEGLRLRFKLHMDADRMYLASVEPYDVSDLDRLLNEIKKNILAMIPYVTEDQEKRVNIYENGDFNSLWSIFLEGDKISDKSVLYLAIEALVQFLKDDKIIMLFMTSDKIFQTFDIFAKCLMFPGAVPPSTRSSIIDIISQLLRAGVIFFLENNNPLKCF